jgi:2',3'-cyclic-nucleotide 2'-phosphodiesterase (5'-nucleotidase family)
VEADIGLQNSGGIRASIAPGPVTLADFYTVLPFENTVVRVRFSGEQVRRLLEYVGSRRGYDGFAQLTGVEWTVEGDEVREIRIGGAPLDPAGSYTLATNNFCYHGGDGFTILSEGEDPYFLETTLREVVVEAARKQGVLRP